MYKAVVILLCTVAGTFSSNTLEVIDRGVKIILLPSGAFQVGLITIPVNTLCRFLDITRVFQCHVCAADCTAVHNRYSGQCGTATGKDGEVCVCNDAPPANGSVPSPVQTCGALTAADLLSVGQVTTNESVNTVTLVREKGLLCPFGNSTGCGVDCFQNHQYRTGACGKGVPVPLTPNATNTAHEDFCICRY